MKAMEAVGGQPGGRLLMATLLAACFLLMGFTFSSNLSVPTTEEEKRELREKGFKWSPAHYKWSQVAEQKFFSDPKNDEKAFKKVKKVAVVSFGVNLYAKKKTGSLLQTANPLIEIASSIFKAAKEKEAIKPEEMKSLTDGMYDDFITALRGTGWEVVSTERVLECELYKRLETGAADGQVSGIWSLSHGWKASATGRGLKLLSAADMLQPGVIITPEQMQKNAGVFQELARALEADAVMVVKNDVYLEASRMGGSYDLLYANNDKGPDGIMIDLFFAEEPKLIWSISLAQPLEVPTEAGQENRLAALAGWTKYEFGKVMGDLAEAYRTILEVIVEKIKADR